jgi:hypothetical protein
LYTYRCIATRDFTLPSQVTPLRFILRQMSSSSSMPCSIESTPASAATRAPAKYPAYPRDPPILDGQADAGTERVGRGVGERRILEDDTRHGRAMLGVGSSVRLRSETIPRVNDRGCSEYQCHANRKPQTEGFGHIWNGEDKAAKNEVQQVRAPQRGRAPGQP